ncbi:MAG: NADH-quinone oxidoreductase subunit NuoG, partial [Armatimonadota bacterium]
KDENDAVGRIGMACMTPAVDGARVSIVDPEAADFRRQVIEWLMINHPHDCPVCDEGGECHLQDMTTMCGHVYRRYRGRKRTHNNQNLGPFVNHEMNRCIQCYRCTRFYRDYAGGRDLNVFAWKNHVYFGRAEDGAMESEFAGNLVEVCPTGVFTDKTLKRHYTRKWDLMTAPSICVHCGLGCNTTPGARYGMLRRIHSKYHSEINGYFICDRGRFGYEFVNDRRRERVCRIRTADGHVQVSWDEALKSVSVMLQGAGKVIGIGSPRASLESNYALKKLVGDGMFSTGLSAYEHETMQHVLEILADVSIRTPSLAEVQTADVIVLLGADPTNEAPMLDMAIRQAMRNAVMDISRKLKIPDWDANAVNNAIQGAKGKLYVMVPWGIKLEEIAEVVQHISYQETAEIAAEVCRMIRSGVTDDGSPASRIVADLLAAKNPLVVSSISAGVEVVESAAEIVRALSSAGKTEMLSIIVPEVNTVGVSMLSGVSVDSILERLSSDEADTLIVLENDLSRRVNSAILDVALDKARNVIVMDCIETSMTTRADVILPTPTYAEYTGTMVNNETRAQRFFQVFVPKGEARTAWQIASSLGAAPGWATHEDVLQSLADELPVFAPALEAAPDSSWRTSSGLKIARETHRSTGRTSMYANTTVFEPQSPDDAETPFTFSMEGSQNTPPGPLVQRFWYPGWNSDNSVTRFQDEVNGPLAGGESVRRLIAAGETLVAGGGAVRQEPHPPHLAASWLIPRPYIFGSDELSRFSPGIVEMTPKADMRMHPNMAANMGIVDGQMMGFVVDGVTRCLPVRLDVSTAEDAANVPMNFDETLGITAPAELIIEVES